MKTAALDFEVSYVWSKDYGLLAEIEGDAQYLVTSGQTYVPQVKPAHTDARLTGTGTQPTAAQVRVYQNENDKKQRDWATTVGFRRGMGENWRNCLQPRYWEQLEQTTFKWKRITPRMYIEHLQDVWVKLDEPTIEAETNNYKRGWADDEHITSFNKRLTREQGELLTGKIIITNDMKLRHYMIEMWKRAAYFEQPTMKEWTDLTDLEKTYARATQIFEDRARALEDFKMTSGAPSPTR